MAKPVICAVNGMAAGAGLDLVTTCDIAIASETATFFDPHVSIGLVSAREAVRLTRVLPTPVAMRIALMGKQERLSAQRAYELGLVTELVAPARLMERAWEIAELLNRNAPLAVRGTRLGIRQGLTLPIVAAELIAEGARLRVAHSDDAREGPLAFLEKRAPVWRCR
jgi:enoyl-CoA hydratase/carnithine racemase